MLDVCCYTKRALARSSVIDAAAFSAGEFDFSFIAMIYVQHSGEPTYLRSRVGLWVRGARDLRHLN